jgi:hypothetical protein
MKGNNPFKERMIAKGHWDGEGGADSMWVKMATCIRKVAGEVLEVTKGNKHEAKDTWWWNVDAQKAIKECYKSWHHNRSTNNMVKYKEAKKNARRAMSEARGADL